MNFEDNLNEDISTEKDEMQSEENSLNFESLTNSERERVVKTLKEDISNGLAIRAIKLKEKFSIPNEIIDTPELKVAFQIRIANELTRNDMNSLQTIIELIEGFNPSDEILMSSAIQRTAKKAIQETLLAGDNIQQAANLKNLLDISGNLIQDEDIQGAIDFHLERNPVKEEKEILKNEFNRDDIKIAKVTDFSDIAQNNKEASNDKPGSAA